MTSRSPSSVLLVSIILCGWIPVTWAGPKGTVIVKGVSPGTIDIDGGFSDWPLGSFTQRSEQPPYPEALIAFETDALGDHIVFDIDRVGLFNGTVPDELTKDGVQDFGVANYFAHDGQFLYVLGVFIDQRIRGDRDTSEFGSGGFTNDGFEFFIDANNDTDDDAAGISFPLFDEEEPNLEDFQVTVALNDFFRPEGADDDVLGARQHMERAGTVALLGPIDPDTGEQIKNAPDPGGESYRAALDAATEQDGIPDIAARRYDDLRAAAAPNPEIADNANEEFAGYAVEVRVPFGLVDAFTPDHSMGFDIFWRDFDDEGDVGGANQSWIDWTQNEAVQCDESAGEGLFCGFNWGQLEFEEVPQPNGDFDGNGTLDLNDIDLLGREIAGGGSNLAFDLDGDGAISGADRDAFLGLAGKLNGDADFDGQVQFADFVILSENFGLSDKAWSEGDFDTDGEVQFSDFVILSENFGLAAPGTPAAVPEPSSILLAALAVLSGLRLLRQA